MKQLLIIGSILALSASPYPNSKSSSLARASETTINAAKNFVLKVKEAYPYPKTSSSMYSRCPSGYQDNVLAEQATYELEDGFLNGYVALYSGCVKKLQVQFRVEDASGKLEARLVNHSKLSKGESTYQNPKDVLVAVEQKYQKDHNKKSKVPPPPPLPEKEETTRTVSRTR